MNPWLIAVSRIAEVMKDGKLPGALRDTCIIFVLTIGTGYVAKMDKRFEGIEASISKMSESVIQLNEAVTLSTETTGWHGKEIERHSREIERQWDRISAIEEGARNGGLDIPKVHRRTATPEEPPSQAMPKK